MSELRIIRGRDITLLIGKNPLFGVTEFSAAEKRSYHKVHECMRSEAAAYVPQKTGYELKLKMLSFFDRQLPETGSFILTVRYEDEEYIYENCRLTEKLRAAKGAADAECICIMQAQSMTWREVEDE